MQKIVPCLWFNGDVEAATQFYVTLLPDSHIDRVLQSPADTPSGPAGMVLTIEFTLAGMKYMPLSFPSLKPYRSRSIARTRLKSIGSGLRLIAGGGSEIACGWIKDRWGLSWQIVPIRLVELLNDSDRERAKRAQVAMMKMVKLDFDEIERASNELS